ncbi:MAG: uracil-DNA glycosylase [Pseudonocardiales bacterium]|nr:uracil-DNA glycosylase [Pseudonocardiales bacterium]
MVQDSRKAGAAPYLPSELGLSQLRAAARSCQGCDLYRNAIQTVFGEGPARARLMLIGEQPGDVEDREGKPSSARAASCYSAHSLTSVSSVVRCI